jgi:large subunit ribosomal protein L13
MGTMFPKTGEVSRDWWVVDLSGQTLGRAASQIASLLRGKHKTIFSSHVDTGDFVVVINAEKVAMTGRKLDQKHYHSHSGFLGSIKSVPARQMLADKPEELIKQAVKRMLPRNALGRATFSKLKIYAGAEHPHSAQNPKPFTIAD